MKNFQDIIMILMVTLLSIIFVIVPWLSDTYLRTVFGLLLILFMPGYSLIAFLFTKKKDLTNIERITFSFGLSIALTVLIGLILNYTPFGIRLIPVLISISLLTILLCIFAYIRRINVHEDERFSVKFEKLPHIRGYFKKESKTDKILSILLILSIIFAGSMIIYKIITPKQDEIFTEFYLLGPNGKASDYPTNLTAGKTGNVTIGILNHEQSTTNYHLLIKLNNITIKNEDYILSNNEKKEIPFTFSPSKTRQAQKLEFLLYKLPDDNNIYRSLHLWINVS